MKELMRTNELMNFRLISEGNSLDEYKQWEGNSEEDENNRGET